MLCLTCFNRRDEVPEKVVVDEEDITENLKMEWEAAADMEYPICIYCDARKAVIVGDPASPAKSVTECAEFTEA